ncbi:poly(R)-hydroxyalkanoic acid synthase subunit PhaE [Paraburkholderia fungorum]|uniref:poly(R)-hydroxyalkanoic acid synthase subunit PhaE n=1 Tax=Paraburkholderia fungorum TaxID=134537 RepID=UPI0038B8DEB2
MSHSNQNWADGWIAMQQAFVKSMFPSQSASPSASDSSAEEEKPPMQEQFADLQETWKESIEKWAAFAKDGEATKAWTPDALREMFSPAHWSGRGAGAFDSSLQHVIEGPRYATLWNLDRKVAELQQLSNKRNKAVLAYQAIVQRAWNTALERFVKTVSSTKGEAPGTWRGLIDGWLKVANESLIEAHRSDEFVEAQTRMLRAASDYRLQERVLAEAWCEACHIPTRTEMDEMQRTVTELRRQIRLLQRQNAPQIDIRAAPARPRQSRAAASKSDRSIHS